MVGIPAGTFLMGSPKNEQGRFDSEGPQRVVSIKAFALGKYDITTAQFIDFLKSTGHRPMPCNRILGFAWGSPGRGLELQLPNWPAVCLEWIDAEAYVAWLNAKVHKERPALAPGPGPYRLPSEAEWEYAARAGTKTARWWGEAIGRNRANCNERMGRSIVRHRRKLRPQPVRPLRHVRKRLAMDRRLLASELYPRS